MSNAIQSFAALYNNPFIFGPLFPPFYKSFGEKPRSILLSYLILPIVLYPESRTFLVHAKSTSSIHTMVKKRDRIYGIDERIAEYREFTNISVQYAIDIGVFQLTDSLSVHVKSNWPGGPLCSPDSIKAASRLGQLFTPFDIPTIYRLLGVKKL